MSTLSVDTITGQTTAANVKMPKGHVIQVESTTVTAGDTTVSHNASSNANAYQDIPGMSVSITPKYATSKILVMYNLHASANTGQTIVVRLMRGSTPINVGTGASAGQQNASNLYRTGGSSTVSYDYEVGQMHGNFLDSPATTNATTYKLQFTGTDTYTYTLNLNRTRQGSSVDEDYNANLTSSITVMEISQ